MRWHQGEQISRKIATLAIAALFTVGFQRPVLAANGQLNKQVPDKPNEIGVKVKVPHLKKPIKKRLVKMAKVKKRAVVKRIVRSKPVTGSHTDWMRAAGIPSNQWGAVEFIISHESGWNYKIWNTGGSGAYGLCQALPGSKMASAGSDWRTNPVTQLKWCNGYAQSRYGGWWQAKSFWVANSWW